MWNKLKQWLHPDHITRSSIKEGFDDLPAAVCYFTPDGIIRLCNRQMFRVYRALSGRDLQSLKELYQQVWAPAPEAPVLPVVQDARPDPAPAPAPAPAPETPVLPAVQDAKLIQTGTSGWLADLMLGAGMVLSAAGYWMERKRKAMFYKSQHLTPTPKGPRQPPR